ncbi:MAG: hypothetical protein ACI8RU_000932 [Zhongshania aliphaticivorans]|jgi:hypothetical protein
MNYSGGIWILNQVQNDGTGVQNDGTRGFWPPPAPKPINATLRILSNFHLDRIKALLNFL